MIRPFTGYFVLLGGGEWGWFVRSTFYRKEGIYRGWYKGLSMNMIKGPLAVSIAYTTNDYLKIGLQWLLQEMPVVR